MAKSKDTEKKVELEANDGDQDEAQTPDTPEPEAPESAPDSDPEISESVDIEASDGGDTDEDAVTEDTKDDAASDPFVEMEEVAPAAPPPQEPARRASPVPLVIAGIVAAAVGYGAAYLGLADQSSGDIETLRNRVAAQEGEIAALGQEIANLSAELSAATTDPGPDLDALRDDILSAVPEPSDVSPDIDALRGELGQLRSRVETLASTATGGASDLTSEEMAAFRSELDQAISNVETQLADAVAEAQADMEAARAAAVEVEAQAEADAANAMAEGALAQLAAALESGSAYAEPLDAIAAAGLAIPPDLSAHAGDGVVSLPALVETFPDAARAALEASISVADAETATDRMIAFLRVQTGARSTAPREGDDPDAVLSRAEAALRSGDIQATLREISALPDTGQAAMNGWVAEARARQDALAALATLRSDIETN